MKARSVIGLGGSRVAGLREICEALLLEGGAPTGEFLSAYDYASGAGGGAGRQGFAVPPDQSEDFDQARFFAELRTRAALAGGPLLVLLGPLSSLPLAREACDV
ncbi:MAG: hypothetical protein WCL50_06490, partial [Spirochaetota bacterium]